MSTPTARLSIKGMRETKHPQIFVLETGGTFHYFHQQGEKLHQMRYCAGGIYICAGAQCDPFNEGDFLPVKRQSDAT